VFMACGIAMGIVGGMVAGWLPRAVSAWFPTSDGSLAVLCLSSALAAVSIPALLRLPRLGVSDRESRQYPSGRFLVRFLIAVGVWNFGTGLFNPFFNAYFARRLGASTSFIGTVFSAGQLSQIAALLITPFLLRAMSFARGIAVAQVIAGLALIALAEMMPLSGAAILYIVYMSAQYSSEPRMLTLLMGRMTPQQQGGASAFNFLTAFLSEALAAFLAGLALTRFGYPPVLIAAGLIAILAAMLFARLNGRTPNDGEHAGAESL
jgi:predicted MFS family arabinose efflux permease